MDDSERRSVPDISIQEIDASVVSDENIRLARAIVEQRKRDGVLNHSTGDAARFNSVETGEEKKAEDGSQLQLQSAIFDMRFKNRQV